MRHQAIKIELKTTAGLFASFILMALLSVSSIGVARVDTWERKADMPTARWHFSTCVVDGKIYAIGGAGAADINFSAVEAYDPATDTWEQKTDMPTARRALSVSVVDGKIYVIGGKFGRRSSGFLATSMVEVYDPATDTWERKADLPISAGVYVSVGDGKIYVIGGIDAAGNLEVYDSVTDTWEQKADMPTARSSHSTSVVDGKIYAIGGFEAAGPQVSTVEVYNPGTDTWEQKADMPTARNGLSTSVVDGKIYAIGGFHSGFENVLTVEVYDPTTDTWTRRADMPTARSFFSVSALNGKIYAIGGTDGSKMTSTVEAYDTGIGIRVQVISPQEGSPTSGEPIAMSGTGFPPDAIVTIGGNPLIDQEIINGTVISGLTPPGTLGEHTLLITSPSYPMSDLFYQTTFLYPSPVPPTITAITPNRGPLTGGQVATIEGNGFIPGVSVVISDVEAKVIAFTETHITFTTPAHTEGAKFVLVRNVDRKVGFLDGGYTYIDVEFPPEDLNVDGVVNLFDLVLVASQFGQVEANLSGDVNGDGTVDLFDLVRVASHFGETAVGAAPPGVDWAVNLSVFNPERVRHALAELEAMTDGPHRIMVAIKFLRAWLGNLPATETKLLPNYPNPFNPETWIPYQLASDADVQIQIYDIKGALVYQLDLGHQKAGYYVNRDRAAYWDGCTDNGEQVSSGAYFYRLNAETFSAIGKMAILK